MLRLLVSIMVALGLFASPMLMAGGAAAARTSDAADQVAAHEGHCDQTRPDGEDRGTPQDLACSGICSAFLVAAPALADLELRRVPVTGRAGPAKLSGLELGHDPPPPRFAPVI
jgi:hypothetical protein